MACYSNKRRKKVSFCLILFILNFYAFTTTSWAFTQGEEAGEEVINPNPTKPSTNDAEKGKVPCSEQEGGVRPSSSSSSNGLSSSPSSSSNTNNKGHGSSTPSPTPPKGLFGFGGGDWEDGVLFGMRLLLFILTGKSVVWISFWGMRYLKRKWIMTLPTLDNDLESGTAEGIPRKVKDKHDKDLFADLII